MFCCCYNYEFIKRLENQKHNRKEGGIDFSASK